MTHSPQSDLIGRSHRFGADKTVTNYGGGNTSAKGQGVDPSTGKDVELLWVKGSGGDLGSLTESGLAVLRLDRFRELSTVFRGPEHDDEMIDFFDYVRHGQGGAAPSIDTSMHALVEADHVDHLHPDAGIAIATAADGEALTAEIFGGKVAWVNWRRPGFQLGLDISALQKANPELIGVILGGHGITAWGETSELAEQNSLWIIRTAEDYIASHGKKEPFGPAVSGFQPLPEEERHSKAAALLPHVRSLASTDKPQVGHYIDSPEVLDFLASREHPRLAALGTSCPDHFLRTKVRPLVLDLPATASIEDAIARLKELHVEYRADYQAYYDAYASTDSPAIRGADPAIVLVPGVGMFSWGADKKTARLAGEYFVNAINAMRGAEALSTYQPIPDSEKFRVEYWILEENKLRRMPKPKALATRIALVTGAAGGIGKAIAIRLAAEGACVVIADLDLQKAQAAAAEIGNTDVAIGVRADVTSESDVAAAVDAAVLAFGGVDLVVNNAGLVLARSLLNTSVADWDIQHNVMAKGSFLVSRATARVMIDQALGGDIIYISSKNSIFAGPENLAYSAAKADQAHQVRLLAAELGGDGIRVNGINPDGVVRGSGMFANGWGAKRAAVYGVPEDELGEYYAQRTLLKREVLPENVANAVFVLCSADLSHTTGLHIPVDAGVAAAFLR
ncbi:bifunctional aldolase/short-chain dehydrogenase [Naasia lichenicola]|uniref:Bifunctional aldolase/short-chain dehydrogenase n=1 Tax=Naasia lichenicola TaxID=2565933 RepID=A0A4S4FHN1_9MICO|nr:bifunctional aldolase/short-chain dehydrogenase [Naasia lichenicola]THG29322.1 bifunctional aldolase/short-chain dehydrogenase [Naasia lichenicola]